MKKLQHIIVLSLFISFLSSCMVTKTNIGEFKETKGGSYTYSKARQLSLAGLIRINKPSPAIPASKNCQIKTSIRLADALISTITCGIIRSQSIRVLAKTEEKK